LYFYILLEIYMATKRNQRRRQRKTQRRHSKRMHGGMWPFTSNSTEPTEPTESWWTRLWKTNPNAISDSTSSQNVASSTSTEVVPSAPAPVPAPESEMKLNGGKHNKKHGSRKNRQ
jgi:hypothetical protein